MQLYTDNIERFLTMKWQQFIVPVYQRNYSWEEKQCEKLFQDLFEVVKSEQDHFLGTIFLRDEYHKFIVIDGQQRITSIFLLLKALYDHTTDKNIKKSIDDYFYSDQEKRTVRLQLNKKDNENFCSIIKTTDHELLTRQIDALSEEEKQSHIIINYLYFCHYIENYLDEEYEINQLLSCLAKVSIGILRLDDEDPQEIYESLNSTGLALTAVDQLRNYLLMSIPYDKQIEYYNKYWFATEDYVGTANMEQFFIDFLVYKRRTVGIISITGKRSSLSSANLYSQFKLYYQSMPGNNSIEKIENLLDDIRHCAFLYKDFCFPSGFTYNCNDHSSLQQRLYPILSIGKSKAQGVRSLLLYIRNLVLEKLISEDTFDHVINIIESFVFRSILCSYTKEKRAKVGLNLQFAGNIILKLSEITDYSCFINYFITAITAGMNTFSFPSDEEIKFSLLHSDSYVNHATKYVLYRLELASPYSKGITAYNEKTLQIEHVLPQTLNNEWKEKLPYSTKNKHNELCSLLGNLALTNNNQKLSNDYFTVKKQTYAQETFYNTRQLAQYDQWTETEIIQRTQQMIATICQIWKVPTASITSFNDTFTIDTDTSFVNKKSPEFFMFKNSIYPVRTWKQMLIILFEALYNENPDIINQFAAINPKLFHTKAETKNYYAVGNTSFFTSEKSAEDTLKVIQKLLSFYDDEADTDYCKTTKFTLK